MAGVQADADARFVVHEGDDVAEVFEGRADHVAGAGHVFQDRFYVRGGGEGAVERGGDARYGGRAGVWAGCAGAGGREWGLVGVVEGWMDGGMGRVDCGGQKVDWDGYGLEVVEFDAEGFAAVEVVEEGGVGLLGFGWVFLREVDEVGAVGEDVTVRDRWGQGLKAGTECWWLTLRHHICVRRRLREIGHGANLGAGGFPTSFGI